MEPVLEFLFGFEGLSEIYGPFGTSIIAFNALEVLVCTSFMIAGAVLAIKRLSTHIKRRLLTDSR